MWVVAKWVIAPCLSVVVCGACRCACGGGGEGSSAERWLAICVFGISLLSCFLFSRWNVLFIVIVTALPHQLVYIYIFLHIYIFYIHLTLSLLFCMLLLLLLLLCRFFASAPVQSVGTLCLSFMFCSHCSNIVQDNRPDWLEHYSAVMRIRVMGS